MDSSAGLRRRSWLLVARWPGVWLRWMGGTGMAAVGFAVVLALDVLAVLPARSRSSRRRRLVLLLLLLLLWLSSNVATSSSAGEASCWIFCDRITLERWGERGVWRPGSAMAGHRAHWPRGEVVGLRGKRGEVGKGAYRKRRVVWREVGAGEGCEGGTWTEAKLEEEKKKMDEVQEVE